VPAVGESSQHTDTDLGQSLCDLRVCAPQPSELWPSDHFLLIADVDF
jgi:hypothetical protein